MSLALPLPALGSRPYRSAPAGRPARFPLLPRLMFDKLRQSLDELIAARTRPEERRAVAARMKETLVLAKLGLDDLQKALEQTRSRVATERRELETVARRKALAVNIGDAETVAIAERFEKQHGERLVVLERKLAAQEEELEIARRDVREMTAELRSALSGSAPPGSVGSSAGGPAGGAAAGAPGEDDPLADVARDERADELAQGIDALGRQARRAQQEQRAEDLLAELKRRMGK